MDNNQTIKCRVESCRYHNMSDCCDLHDIVVGCDRAEAQSVKETQCMSFEVK